jgi:hypothetical protein
MSKLRYFFLSMNVLNGLLAAAVVAVVFYAVIPFLNPAAVSLPAAMETAAGSMEKAAAPQRSSPTDYAMISEQNLFHPERKIPPEKQQDKVLPKPDLFLYGTLITDKTSYAFVEDRKAPYSTAGRGKRQLTLKKGESLGGYIVSEIETNRIVLVKGEERLVISLDDKEKRRAGEAPVSPATAGSAPGGMPAFTPVAPSPSRAAPSSAQPAISAGQRIGGIPGPGQSAQPVASPQAAQSSAQGPTLLGPAMDGSTPTSRRSKLQEVQKMKEARPMSQE